MKKIVQPPSWALLFFRSFCRREIIEDIEGDLLEKFYYDVNSLGTSKAKQYFVLSIFSLLRPGIVKNPFSFHYNNTNRMKWKNWLNLLLVNGLLLILISLPFLPGPPNRLAIGLSGFLQSAGFPGIIFLPLGLLWFAVEIFRLRNTKKASALSGLAYGIGITALIILALFCIVFCAMAFSEAGAAWGSVTIITFIAVFYFLFKRLYKLRENQFSFHPFCLYLIFVPLITFGARKIFIQPLSEMSRVKTIEQANRIISSLENFNDRNNRYPGSLAELQKSDPSVKVEPATMGVLNFRYTKINDGYSLSFSQWLEMGSLEEIVLYDKHGLRNLPHKYDYSNDLVRVNYAFESYDTRYPDWRYYQCD